MPLSKLPNFLIIGTGKCGTTSLYAYLRQHPQVFMSTPKEPTFFGYEGQTLAFSGPGDQNRAFHAPYITDFAAYTALFDRVGSENAIGEASVHYLYLPGAPKSIKHHIPDAKLLAVLRNPAD